MIIITSSILDGTSSGSRDDAGGSSGKPRDTKSLAENMFTGSGPKTEHSRSKKKSKKKKSPFILERIYQLGIDVPVIDDDDSIPSKSH